MQNSAPTPATQAEVIRERLMSQITAPVRWIDCVEELVRLFRWP